MGEESRSIVEEDMGMTTECKAAIQGRYPGEPSKTASVVISWGGDGRFATIKTNTDWSVEVRTDHLLRVLRLLEAAGVTDL
jgi:hypothetical protein